MLAGGTLHRGRNGMAGEFGHMQVVPDGRPCQCGGGVAGSSTAPGVRWPVLRPRRGPTLTGPALTAAAQAGDPAAVAAYAEVGRWLGVGVANLVAGLTRRSSWSVVASRRRVTCCSSPRVRRWRRAWSVPGTASCRTWSAPSWDRSPVWSAWPTWRDRSPDRRP